MPTVVIALPGKAVYSETFIRAHIERLPAKVRLVYGGTHQEMLPRYRDNGVRMAANGWAGRLGRRLRGQGLASQEQEALKRFLVECQAGAVLAEFGVSGVAMLDACRELGLPLAVHFHGYDAYNREILGGVGRRYPELFAQSAAIIAVSADMERQLLKLGAPPDRLHLNPYGVDLERFQGASPAQAEPLLLAVGRFVDKKAPYLTLLAFSRVVAEAPAARLIMVGDGPLWDACYQLRRTLGLEERVELPGALSHDEVAALTRQARAFVQHSLVTTYGDMEGTPVSILEAAGAGLPILATHHGGIPEVISDGVHGFLVAEGDVAAMAAQMARLIREPALAGVMGAAAHERILADYSMAERLAALWRIIEAVMIRVG
jgi:glycosyltransferase involved in cell wall biosynthesis